MDGSRAHIRETEAAAEHIGEACSDKHKEAHPHARGCLDLNLHLGEEFWPFLQWIRRGDDEGLRGVRDGESWAR
jgi:hypothetical protein